MTVTMGQKGGNQDTFMQPSAGGGDEKKTPGKEGEGTGKASKIKDPNQAHETLDIAKNVPQARFGHTITMVNKYKVVLFGGATGDTGKYSMTGETFIFNMLLRTWTELNVKGVPPSPRAAHASTNVEQMQMVVYGGATGGGSLASDDLYLLDMRNGEDQA